MSALRPALLGALPLLLAVGLCAGCGDDAELGSRFVRTGPDAGPTGTLPPSTPAPGPAAGSDGPDPGSAPPCTGAQLAASLGPPRPSAGGIAQELILQNTGSTPCVMRGFPAVTAVAGNEGTPVGAQATPVGPRGDRIRLAPRAAATIPLGVLDASGYPAAVCRPVPVRGLRVLPPGGSGALFVPRDGPACSADPLTPPQLTVGTAVAR